MLKQENLARITIVNEEQFKGGGWEAFLVRFVSTSYGSFECALIPYLDGVWGIVPMYNVVVENPPDVPIGGPPYEIDE